MTSWISRLRRKNETPAAHPEAASPPGVDSPSAADTPPPVDSPSAVNMVAIEIYTASRAAVPVEVENRADRITDLLNRATSLSVVSGEGSEELDIDEILVVVPPPLRGTDPQRRLHRLRRPIRLQVGPYEIDGHAHVPPGARPSGYMYRLKPHFVPITEAIVRSMVDGSTDERRLPVVITNYRQVDEITELLPDDQPPLAEDLPEELA